MATHLEIQERRRALCEELRQACRDGSLPPDEMLPSVRQMAQQYGVSKTVIAEAVQDLVNEGLFYTVPRMGTFVARPSGELPVFLLVLADQPYGGYAQLIKTGFEAQIAELGGAVATVVKMDHPDIAKQWLSELPEPAGIFFSVLAFACSDNDIASLWPSTPRVHFGVPEQVQLEMAPDAKGADWVAFDDEEGAVLATEHLLLQGYAQIAFLGLNPGEIAHPYYFSTLRERGWRRALKKQGLSCTNLLFVPRSDCGTDRDIWDVDMLALDAANDLVAYLLQNGEIDAVLATGSISANALLEALEQSGLPSERWPAIVSFDDDSPQERHVISSVHLPWDELGRTAAELLVAKAKGRSRQGENQHKLIPMRLVPRLSCRPNWNGIARRSTTRNASRNIKENVSVSQVTSPLYGNPVPAATARHSKAVS